MIARQLVIVGTIIAEALVQNVPVTVNSAEDMVQTIREYQKAQELHFPRHADDRTEEPT